MFHYLDPALQSHLGHYITHCSQINKGLSNLSVKVLNYVSIDADLSIRKTIKGEVIPFFKSNPYLNLSNDELSGWLISFFKLAENTRDELLKINLNRGDKVYFEASSPASLYGFILWSDLINKNDVKLIVNLIEQTGLIGKRDNDGSIVITGQSGVYPVLYRFLSSKIGEGLVFVSIEDAYVKTYSYLLNQDVKLAPHPFDGTAELNRKRRDNQLNIGFIGAQRKIKGFGLVPEIIQTLLLMNLPVNIIVQDGRKEMTAELKLIEEISKANPRLRFINDVLDGLNWDRLLLNCDIIVTPYEESFYSIASSGIANEAIANAIPVVSSSGTSIEYLLRKYNCPGIICNQYSPVSFANAISQMVLNYEKYSEKAFEAAKKWRGENGSDSIADFLNTL